MESSIWNGELYGTFGPQCCDAGTISAMLKEGMTGMRLNMSHTSLSAAEPWIRALQKASASVGVPAELLIDLQGPEVRIDHFIGTVTLSPGTAFHIRVRPTAFQKTDASADEGIYVAEDIFKHFKSGQHLLLDDGALELLIERAGASEARCRVLRGGTLSGGKSLKIVGEDIHRPAVTLSDLENIRAARKHGVTALMQPFVRSGEDLKEVRSALHAAEDEGAGVRDAAGGNAGNGRIRIFAKIESREGIQNLDSILPEADMIVIARGDLGNDMPLWELPAAQKEIERRCVLSGKPFLVVTQLLTSMITSPVPTRAEVSDIFNAVLDGASALMVTNETAVGSHPVEVLRYLKNTAESAANYLKGNVV